MTRHAEYPIDPLFTRRWSPRAMSGQPLTRDEMMHLLEAAHWAPSSGNSQPWRFFYGLAGTPEFKRLYELLVDANKIWCARAGALVLVASKAQQDNGKPQRTHSLDTGAAWMSAALQGTLSGLVVHGMEGFDYDKAQHELELPKELVPEMMFAVGHPGKVEELPERLQQREQPNDRKPVADVVFEGLYRARS